MGDGEGVKKEEGGTQKQGGQSARNRHQQRIGFCEGTVFVKKGLLRCLQAKGEEKGNDFKRVNKN